MSDNYSVETAFYVPIFRASVSNWAERKPKLLSLVDWERPDCQHNDHFTDYFLSCDDGCAYMDDFAKILQPELQAFVQWLGQTVKITNLWSQRYIDQNFMGVHNHGAYGFSAVLYAEFDPGQHTATEFYAPFDNFLDGTVLSYRPDVKEGDIVFFPSALKHCALPSKSHTPRTIFSINLDRPRAPA